MEQSNNTNDINFSLKRDVEGFYICPLCGAPSIFFSDVSMHLKEIHKRLAVRK